MTDRLLDQDARHLITGVDPSGLDRTLFVEAGAGSGKTKSLVDRIVSLVTVGGVDLANIAAITFTEKAAAELRDRVRERLEEAIKEASAEEQPRLREALDQVDVAAISTLHAFAQRILTEHPLEAGLPPNIEVLDEVGSELQFEDRWRDFKRELLDNEDLEQTMLLAFAAGVRLDHLRDLALEFDRNWDLASDPERVPWSITGPFNLDVRGCLEAARAVLAAAQTCPDPSDTLAAAIAKDVPSFLAALEQADDPASVLAVLVSAPSFRWGNKGKAANWNDKKAVAQLGYDLADATARARNGVVEELVHRLAVAARNFVVELGEERRRAGRLEFHDLLVLARDVLRGSDGLVVRTALRSRYRRLLLDEFQDTDPIQIEIAVLLATATEAPAKDWQQVPTEPGRLFFVGDPKQSIYRFRRADISLFLEARDTFGVPTTNLTTNFRTSAPILDWVNGVFSTIMREAERSQPAYVPLDAAPMRGTAAVGPVVAVLCPEPMDEAASADALREVEAEEVVNAIVTAVTERWQVSGRDGDGETWRDCTLGDITILLPSRTSFPALERALEARRVPYRAETSSLVYATGEVRDLLLAVRAIADVTDHLALVSALRSPLFGCGDDDLFRFGKIHRGAFTLARDQHPDVPADDPVALAIAALRELHLDASWLSPSRLLDRLCRERRLFEVGFATGRPRDLWRRLRFVIDHARAWEEAEAGTLREYVEWAKFQASDAARVAESILPETDDDAVRIMTIHGSKGLEFPITIVSGASTRPGGFQGGVQVVWPREGVVGIKVGSKVTTEHFEALKPVDEQMGYDERVRLLYVACTRARDHLVVSLQRKERRNPLPEGDRMLTNAELLAWGQGALVEAATIAPNQAVLPAPPPADEVAAHPSVSDWRTERATALAASARHRTVGASGVQDLLVRARDEGDDKDPLDIELPAWRKGRYGSAIGRAVHGVLQTIDLASGEGVDAAVAGQAAAEGVVGREEDVAQLVKAALASPTVRAAAVATERWRETYVATEIGDTTLEGYLDLLYRDDEGRLVVVDYKTSSDTDDATLNRRTAGYRAQGAAYALAVEAAAGEPVARVVFVYLGQDGAHDRELSDLAAAKAEVLSVLSSS